MNWGTGLEDQAQQQDRLMLPHLGSASSGGADQSQLQSMQLQSLGNPFQQQGMDSMDRQPVVDFPDAPNLMLSEAGNSTQPLVSNNSGVDLSSLRSDFLPESLRSCLELKYDIDGQAWLEGRHL